MTCYIVGLSLCLYIRMFYLSFLKLHLLQLYYIAYLI